jgi:large subunit ribosomal protein L7/L12
MSNHSRHQDRIRSLDERLTRLRAERIRLAARMNHAERKRDTRRKIVVGAAVVAAVEREGVPPLRGTTELLRWLDAQLTRPHDRALFDLPRQRTAVPHDR